VDRLDDYGFPPMLATGMPHLSTMHHMCQVCLLVSACFKGVGLLTYLLTYFFFDLFVACGRCHCLWEMGVACFSCMHTIRAEAGLCLLVPAMFASQGYGLHNLFVFLFGVYRDQNTGVEER